MEFDEIPRPVFWRRFLGALFSCLRVKNQVVFNTYDYFASTELDEGGLLKWLNGYIADEAHKIKKLLHLRRGVPLIKIVEGLYQVHIPSPADDPNFYGKRDKKERRKNEKRVVEIVIDYLEKTGVLPVGKISPRKVCAGKMKTIGKLGFHLRDHYTMTKELSLGAKGRWKVGGLSREVDSLPSLCKFIEQGFDNTVREAESLRSLFSNEIFRQMLRLVKEQPGSGLYFEEKPVDDEARPNWRDWRSSMENDAPSFLQL